MEFKDKLKQLRQEKGLSQQALADAIHISRSAVAKWENGLGFPSEDSVEALTAYFHVEENYFRTEEPETVIVRKNHRIRILKTVLGAILILVVVAAVLLCWNWVSSVAGDDTMGLAKQAADYLGYEELEIMELTKRGDYMAALCKDSNNNWCLCVFDRDDVFRNRWVAGGGKRSLDSGVIGSWNYGSPQGEAVLIICGADLPDDICWYTFENDGVEYTCSVDDGMVLDIFIILDSHNINGHPVPLDEAKQPIP